MKKKLVLLALSTGVLLAAAAPSQASIAINPGSLDFGTFPSTSPPKTLLYANVTISADEVNKYATGVKMLSGGKSFFASSDCAEVAHPLGQAVQCTVGVRYEPGEYGITYGANAGVIGLSFGPTELATVETKEIPVTATVTAAIAPPPVTPQPTPSAPGASGNHHKKKKCTAKMKAKKKCKGSKGKHKGKTKH